MAKHRIRRIHSRQRDGVIGGTALNVAAKMDGNPAFLDPKVKLADLKMAAQNFNDAVGVCQDGTRKDTLYKKALKAALIAMLDTQADYVEANSNNNPVTIASSGFPLANRGKNSPVPVGTVSINALINFGPGGLNLDMAYGPHVWCFEVEVSITPGVWVPAGFFTDPRNVTPSGLTPGQMYAVRVRVHGSKNQVSGWSDVVSHRAM